MSSTIKVISDSTCDLSKELIERYQIQILPLHIILGDKEFEDGVNISPDEIYAYTLYQIGALRAFCAAAGTELQHVKPHGAMYNQAAKKLEEAEAVAAAVRDAGGLILLGLAGSAFEKAAEACGVPFAAEAFADRGYMPDGTLAPRSRPDAFVRDPEAAASRVIRMIREGVVEAVDGTKIELRPDSICLHGDSASAVEMAKTLRARLEEDGITIAPLKNVMQMR